MLNDFVGVQFPSQAQGKGTENKVVRQIAFLSPLPSGTYQCQGTDNVPVLTSAAALDPSPELPHAWASLHRELDAFRLFWGLLLLFILPR